MFCASFSELFQLFILWHMPFSGAACLENVLQSLWCSCTFSEETLPAIEMAPNLSFICNWKSRQKHCCSGWIQHWFDFQLHFDYWCRGFGKRGLWKWLFHVFQAIKSLIFPVLQYNPHLDSWEVAVSPILVLAIENLPSCKFGSAVMHCLRLCKVGIPFGAWLWSHNAVYEIAWFISTIINTLIVEQFVATERVHAAYAELLHWRRCPRNYFDVFVWVILDNNFFSKTCLLELFYKISALGKLPNLRATM